MEIPCRLISTAPRDGTIILTNQGVVRYTAAATFGHGWAVCKPSGEKYEGWTDGYRYEFPAYWIPLPTWKLE